MSDGAESAGIKSHAQMLQPGRGGITARLGAGGGGGHSPEDAACEEDTGTRRCSRKGGVQGTAAARGSDGQVQRGSEHRRGRGRRVSHGTHSREGLSWLGRTGYDSVSSS